MVRRRHCWDRVHVGECARKPIIRSETHAPLSHAGAGLGVLLSRRALEAESAKIIALVPGPPHAPPRTRSTRLASSLHRLSPLFIALHKLTLSSTQSAEDRGGSEVDDAGTPAARVCGWPAAKLA